MATQESKPARQGASKKNVQKDDTGAAKVRPYYFKVQLQNSDSASRVWIAIKAGSIGEAFVIADARTLDTRFRIYDGSMAEITKDEYYALISRTI
jgi:hypothetical protein